MTSTIDWQPQIQRKRCIKCGQCIEHCPNGVLGWQNGQTTVLHPDACDYCLTCEDICPSHAIELPFLIIKESRES